ncbi:MAG: FAD-dependent oxidoreductase [Pirellula sp.]|jgi:photolyase PhrII
MSIAELLSFENVPIHLYERIRVVTAGTAGKSTVDHSASNSSSQPGFVLYWMRTAVRVDENPALDVARHLAIKLDLPLLVYHGLSQRYPFASDRHHTFILEGARDVQRRMSEIGISYAFYLERSDTQGDYLRQLADASSVTVTEDMPTRPSSTFLRALCRQCRTPIVAVDTACVVPMRSIGQAYTRAFEFRQATQRQYKDRVPNEWPLWKGNVRAFDIDSLPFKSIDLNLTSIADWIAQCDIDHTVGPVVDTEGGSTAGYSRWNRFCQSGLSKYAKTRNSPLINGTSRMSAYLHYGMVSPMRIAREASQQKGEGPEKYLDELLIWRELAYAFCHYRSDHDHWSAIPDWARKTLELHAKDRRAKLYSWEQLARGESDDPLWNVAQKSLLMHGELHNNIRMTWGKAILNWTPSPQCALKYMLDLNHRYALDGRDPGSYGGILWCLGQFDRPFEPETSIQGTIRPRPTNEHAQRLNVEKYKQLIQRNRAPNPPTIAVVGAGISGAMAARTLADHGLQVTVFDKSRGMGGRMSTRHLDEHAFDHGAQYFTVRHPVFRRYVQSWVEQGVAALWEGTVVAYDRDENSAEPSWHCHVRPSVERFVGTPGMTSIAKHLLKNAEMRLNHQVIAIEPDGSRLRLMAADGLDLGVFDQVILAIPAPQASSLVPFDAVLSSQLASVRYDPCWCAMFQFEEQLPSDWNGAFVNGGAVRWIARSHTKPGRYSKGESLVIHAAPDWSAQSYEKDQEFVMDTLLEEYFRVTGQKPQIPTIAMAHRWRYSIPISTAVPTNCFQHRSTVIACGDWAGGSRVEGAFLSGCAAAGRVLSKLDRPSLPKTQTFLF